MVGEPSPLANVTLEVWDLQSGVWEDNSKLGTTFAHNCAVKEQSRKVCYCL